MVKAYRAYLSEEKAKSALGVMEKMRDGAAGRELMDFPGGMSAEEPRINVGVAANRKSPYAMDG